MKVPQFFRRHTEQPFLWLDKLYISLSLLVFAILSLGNMTRWSIWFDESFSAYLMRFNVIDIARYTATDVHPPLYYWLLKGWVSIWGVSELALRSLSMIFMMAAMVVVYYLMRKLFTRNSAAWSVGLLAISPMIVRYSEEARMYGLVVLIVAAATYMLVEATAHPSRKKWLWYGVLIALGMWTHYFTAIVWLSHWIWRFFQRGRFASTRAFFNKDWLLSHVLAIGLFLPWIPTMYKQMTTVQESGFWIKTASIDSPINFLSNTFLYLEHNNTVQWLAILLLATLVVLIIAAICVYRKLDSGTRQWYELLVVMALGPVILLLLLSMPPLRPSFVERYLIPASFWFTILCGVTIAYLHKEANKILAWSLTGLVVVSMIIGVINVYTYGNFNRNANEAAATRDMMQLIEHTNTAGEPVIAESPWRFYEAIFYDQKDHPVYFEATDNSIYGSYDMLRYSDFRKIHDISSFARDHQTVWYFGSWQDGKSHTPSGNWKVLRELTAPTPVAGSGTTHAFEVQYIGR